MDTSMTEEPAPPFPDYEEKLKNCTTLKKWMYLIKEL